MGKKQNKKERFCKSHIAELRENRQFWENFTEREHYVMAKLERNDVARWTNNPSAYSELTEEEEIIFRNIGRKSEQMIAKFMSKFVPVEDTNFSVQHKK